MCRWVKTNHPAVHYPQRRKRDREHFGEWQYTDGAQGHRDDLPHNCAKRTRRQVRRGVRGDADAYEKRKYGPYWEDYRPATPLWHPRSHKRSGGGTVERAGLAGRRPMECRTETRVEGTESMSLSIIPLAITMNAGPQIMSAIIFVTAPKALKLSAYFLAGVVIAVTVGVTITYTLATVLGSSVSLGDPSDSDRKSVV